MPDVPVTLTPWFDAKDNPPKDDRFVLTERGTLWAEVPSPPNMSDPLGPLTVKDMWRLYRLAQEDEAASVLEEERVAAKRLAARLRRALDQIEKGGQ